MSRGRAVHPPNGTRLGHGSLADLATTWRRRAAELREYGADGPARGLEHAADELEAALRAEDAELLTLERAAVESGYSADHLARLLRAGKLPNAGRPHAPKLRRSDLPRKTNALPCAPGARMVEVTKEQIARSVVNSKVEVHDG